MNICAACLTRDNLKEIYQTREDYSLDSLTKIINIKNTVFFCNSCSHIMNSSINDVQDYYSENYNINIDSEDEDQLYEAKDNKNIFRTDHQLEVFKSYYPELSQVNILDYGCGKSSMGKKICDHYNDISLHLFEVSDAYKKYWQKITPSERTATYDIPKSWGQKFDIITSFFSLEHIDDVSGCLKTMHTLLRSSGEVYILVPNVLENIADLVVVDHVNHFTALSITTALKRAGFDEIIIDEKSHRGVFVAKAKKSSSVIEKYLPMNHEIESTRDSVISISRFWLDIGEFVDREEEKLTSDIVIYGAGFYGSFLYSLINDKSKISHFVDSNQFLQKKPLFGLEVKALDSLSNLGESKVFVGLNPKIAREIIDQLEIENKEKIDFVFI